MKTLLLSLLISLPLWAADSATNSPAAPPDADAAWKRIALDFHALQAQHDTTSPQMQELVTTAAGETHDFFTQFPENSHAPNALMLWAQLGQLMNAKHWDGAPKADDITQAFDNLASNPKVPREARAQVRAQQLSAALQSVAKTPDDKAAWEAIESRFDSFEKEFGADFTLGGSAPILVMLRSQELSILSSASDQTRFKTVADKLAASPDSQMAAMATQIEAAEARVADLATKPIDLKFTDVDGREIDLAKMRGKVVLIDFWATWCPPCRAEVPNVVAAYEKYHAKGFEVVGISLDQDKDAMVSFTKANGMDWPQYFDGRGWDNAISKSYGIDAIPAMWLVDKNGMVVSRNAAEDLDGQVEKLLGGP